MKKWTKILLSVICMGIVAAWGIRVYWVNQTYPDVNRQYYSMGEEVELGTDRFYYDSMDGYYVTLESAEIYEYEDLLAKYGFSDFQEAYPPDRIYLLKVNIRNTDSTEDGIDFSDWTLQSAEIREDLDWDLYYEMNNIEETAIALRTDSEMEFYLPYNLRDDFFKESDWNNLEEYPMFLTVTWFPNKKMIRINE